MAKIKDLNQADRPREKLKAKGPSALSDFELLQALIGSGNKQADVSKIARQALKLLQKHGVDLTYDLLQQVPGLGAAKITEILAAFELSKRYLTESEQPILDTATKVAEQLGDIRDKKQEHLVCFSLDGANRLISRRIITIGTLSTNLIHPREVFADAITDRAASIIVAHNHPSGTLKPSLEDKTVTERLVKAGNLLGIGLLDHVIIAKKGYYSFADQGLLKVK